VSCRSEMPLLPAALRPLEARHVLARREMLFWELQKMMTYLIAQRAASSKSLTAAAAPAQRPHAAPPRMAHS
jgi:hypothetical protein